MKTLLTIAVICVLSGTIDAQKSDTLYVLKRNGNTLTMDTIVKFDSVHMIKKGIQGVAIDKTKVHSHEALTKLDKILTELEKKKKDEKKR